MAQDGTLEEIITSYLEINGVLGYNTVSDMINATNIINGSICRTLGNTTYNDGYGAYYKIRTITSDDTVDGINIIALNISNTLIAELIPNYYEDEIDSISTKLDKLPVKSNSNYVTVGANGCNYTNINTALTYAKTNATNTNSITILIMGGDYNEQLDMRDCHNINLVGVGKVKIYHTCTAPMAPLYVSGDVKVENIHFYNDGTGAYALHLDPSNTGVTGTCEFRNCIFEVANVSTSAVGLGTASNTIMKFYNCIFKNGGSNAPFFLHTNPYMNSVNSQVWVVDCEFIGKNLLNTAIQIDNGGYDNGYTTSDDQFHFINNSSADSKLVIYKRTNNVFFGYIPYSDNGVKLRPDSYGNDLIGLNYEYTNFANALFSCVKSSSAVGGYYYYSINFKNANQYNITVGDVSTIGGSSITGTTVNTTSSAGIILKDNSSTGAGEVITVRLTLVPKNSNYSGA